jgi:ferric-dicitrate binding protein FerR (iron transport regulator)
MKWIVAASSLLFAVIAVVFGSENAATLDYDVVTVKRHLFLETVEGEEKVSAGDRLNSGQSLRTGSRSRAELEAPDFAARFVIATKTRFKLAHDTPGVLLEVERGSLRAIFGKLAGGDQRERLVTTPSAVLAVRGTEYGIEVEKDGDTSVVVFEGTVEVWDPRGVGDPVRVQAGQSTRVKRGKAPSMPKQHGLSSRDWDQGRRGTGQPWAGSAQSPGMGSGSQSGNKGSGSSGSQGGSKRHGG